MFERLRRAAEAPHGSPDAEYPESLEPKPPRVDVDSVAGDVKSALREIYDPEIPVNIYDLGLVYEIKVDDEGRVDIRMTLTAPACPVAHTFPGQVENAVKAVSGVRDACVELVWDPPWSPERMTEEARLELGML
jgi:FeS assembly SUF system protein